MNDSNGTTPDPMPRATLDQLLRVALCGIGMRADGSNPDGELDSLIMKNVDDIRFALRDEDGIDDPSLGQIYAALQRLDVVAELVRRALAAKGGDHA